MAALLRGHKHERKIDWPALGMTVAEAAQALRVGRKAVFKALQEGGLPARKVGRGYRISPAAVDAWLASGTVKPETDEEPE